MASTDNDSAEDTIHLLDLNDDCLLEIFKYFSVKEILSLFGSICQRIDSIIYQSLSKIKYFSMSLRNPPQFNTQQLEVLGCSLTKLYISAGFSLPPDLTLKYLEPICKHKNLQSLTLYYVQFNEQFQRCIMNVAENLHYLDLSYCQLTDDLLAPILEKCHNLRKLSVYGNHRLECISLKCLKSIYLKELKVEQSSLNKNEVEKFKMHNPQISIIIFSVGSLEHFRKYGGYN